MPAPAGFAQTRFAQTYLRDRRGGISRPYTSDDEAYQQLLSDISRRTGESQMSIDSVLENWYGVDDYNVDSLGTGDIRELVERELSGAQGQDDEEEEEEEEEEYDEEDRKSVV